MSIRAIVIPADDEQPITELDLMAVKANTLDALQDLVGGDIQIIPYDHPKITPVFNENGKNEGLPPNTRATVLLRGMLFPDDYIAGDMALTGTSSDGDTIDLPPHMTEQVVGARIAAILAGEGGGS